MTQQLAHASQKYVSRRVMGDLNTTNRYLQAGRTVSKLLGVEADDLYKCFLKPKVKVGEEFVEKNMTAEQCTQLVGSAAKTIYERVFKWLVTKCNTLLKTGLEPAYFIGVLDVPGFEIFDVSVL